LHAAIEAIDWLSPTAFLRARQLRKAAKLIAASIRVSLPHLSLDTSVQS
jgi:hypothetical protein